MFHPHPSISLKTEVLQKIGGMEAQLLASTRKEAKKGEGKRNHRTSTTTGLVSVICYLKRESVKVFVGCEIQEIHVLVAFWFQ